MSPSLIVLAGPNGAGKSTFYQTFLEDKGLPFVNADLLGKEFHLKAYEAAELADNTRRILCEQNESFITETVFSDPFGKKLDFFKQASTQGYEVTLIYIGLESSLLSEARIRTRVNSGGHDVPKDKIPLRYERSLENLKQALVELDRVILYDNSSVQEPYRFMAEFKGGKEHRRTEDANPVWSASLLDEDRERS